jgi:regulator of protease activity HflC (stomatin/prohibitin superfamily)
VAELLRFVLDAIERLAPVRVVRAWEVGLYLVAGKYRGAVGPGLKLVVPFLCEVVRVPVVPEIYQTPLQSVTLRDGTVLTFSASVTLVVTDAARAYLTVGHYQETVVELAAALLAEGLADADPERFDPARGKRDRLLEELRKELDLAAAEYGMSALALRVNNFVRGVRTVRLLLDGAVLPPRA